jgi:hypothetical protein
MVHVPTIGVVDETIIGLSNSPEMAPWQVGGDYDRPIPRRILEERGIERGTFALQDVGGAVEWVPWAMTETSKADFADWLAAHGTRWRPIRNRVMQRAHLTRRDLRRMTRVPGARWLGDHIDELRILDWDTSRLYHWAFERMLERYP